MDLKETFDATFKQMIAPPARHRVASWDVKRNSDHDRRIWSYIIAHGEKNLSAKKVNTNAACIVGFTSSRTLPSDIAGMLCDFIKTPIPDTTLVHVSKFYHRIPARKLTRYGRGGEGVCFNLKYRKPKQWLRENQHPRLPFSHPEFCNEIREQAHIALFRRLQLSGNVESQLQRFLITLYRVY